MPYGATVFKVFIASPSDVATERKIARDVLLESWETRPELATSEHDIFAS